MAGSSKGSSGSSKSGKGSVSQLLASAIPNFVIAAVFFLLFIALRKSQRRVYEPRAEVKYLPRDLRPDSSPKGLFGWLTHILRKPEGFIIQHAGPDGYFFTRFLFEFAFISLLGCIILWPILFPLSATNSNHNVELDILAFGNIKNKYRYFAHVFLSWIYFGCFIFLIYRELVYYVTFRHALQSTPLYDSLLSSRVLLLTEVPSHLLSETEIRNYFPTSTNLWYARDYEELQELVKERSKLSGKYEGALNKTITKAVNLRNKASKKNKPLPEPADDINQYLKDGKKRPTHKLKFLIGQKVDTLDYCPEKLGELNKDIKKRQLEHNSNTQIPSVFIEFPTQLELQKAYQAIPYNDEFKKCGRYSGLAPADVIWPNLALTPNKRRVKKAIASTVLTLMIIFWSIPVAVVGAISNIDNLISQAPWLSFINNLPSVLLGLIKGLLPVVALAILMSLIPPFIKKMGKVAGCITVQEVERYCQSWFFAFQVVQSFLVMALCSSAMGAVPSIVEDPSTVLPLLAQKLPTSGNFYLAYLCFFGLTTAAALLFQLVALILAQFLGKILDGTPRAKWNRYTTLGQPFFSVLYPNMQLICVIALAYAFLVPLILGFSTITFLFLFAAFLYTLVYVMRPNLTDARGRNYASALFQLFVGLYLSEIVLVAMFVFTKNWACVALEAVVIVATAICHIYFKRIFLPVIDAVPISALKYSAGDHTFQYPMHDQGLKEIKSEGENYWHGGNQLGLTGTQHDQVLPEIKRGPSDDAHNANTVIGSDESAKQDAATNPSSSTGQLINKSDRANVDDEKSPVAEQPHTRSNGSSKNPASILTRFFSPRTDSFDRVRGLMPDAYFNYIEYNPEFLRTAYEDPAVNDEEPHIWIARDEMGLSEIEKNKALEHGVDVSDEAAVYNEKGSLEYTGPPPSYEEALRT
ncbi:DUF221-domain-containing protein [Hyphopichia burtonii NRRL Y-1933]|uniref:DUF221-domain-containing protein n=1 Tax=Hyphopichia burtonii NRRL Y-1933 TaxID=984485 RepID=A0A1E4RKA0_9ASCO|nr:DUF221-domain-containing protein [Hyphopichia burtonii NRRL Y-1933]ODV67707.1 DUF221-domain-containing protein [Hyphopichia burtonii NRRL Y-1933]